MQEKDNLLSEELNKARAELSILYEISNAMHTTLKLDEILYIILTGVTAHIGLSFNRAILFLVNKDTGMLEGKMGIGPDTAEAADSIWKRIDTQRMKLEDLISSFSKDKLDSSKLNFLVKSISVPCIEEKGGILAVALNDGMSLHIAKDKIATLKDDPALKLFNSDEFVVVPLQAKNNVIGLIVADNFVTRKPITKDDIRMLTMFANQAGLAIESSQLYEQTLIRAHTDALTGLWNHGYFQHKLEQLLEKAKEETSYLSLIFVDIDDFKIFNDTCGHQKGDEILVQIAGLFKEVSRKFDYLCRYGGEEFALILPNTNLKDAMAIAERIRVVINNRHFDSGAGHPPQNIACSLGVATFPLHARNKAELIKAADKALYEAKHKGKNNVVSFSY
ncbi:MAG: sensor domain-containing diguanylate cyclase [Candidatus Omnitrophica bacterium]|nr:sensor domain-containing diguanylate cyclase [Candidatus Omnitrophota bacterium]